MSRRGQTKDHTVGMGMDGGYARCLVLFPSRMPGDVSCLPRPGGGPGQTAPNVFFVNPSDIYVLCMNHLHVTYRTYDFAHLLHSLFATRRAYILSPSHHPSHHRPPFPFPFPFPFPPAYAYPPPPQKKSPLSLPCPPRSALPLWSSAATALSVHTYVAWPPPSVCPSPR